MNQKIKQKIKKKIKKKIFYTFIEKNGPEYVNSK